MSLLKFGQAALLRLVRRGMFPLALCVRCSQSCSRRVDFGFQPLAF